MIKKKSDKPTRSMLTFRKTLVDLCQNNSVEDIALKDLCNNAGFTAMAFYYCYDDKYDLAKDIIDGEISYLKGLELSVLNRDTNINPQILHQTTIENLFNHIKSEISLYKCIIYNKLMPDSINYIINELTTKYKKQTQNYELNIESEYHDLIVKIRYNEIFTIIAYWIENNCDISPTKLAELTLKLTLK